MSYTEAQAKDATPGSTSGLLCRAVSASHAQSGARVRSCGYSCKLPAARGQLTSPNGSPGTKCARSPGGEVLSTMNLKAVLLA